MASNLPELPFKVRALYNFKGTSADELNFLKNDVITVIQVVEGGWWEGELNDVVGWFPSNHVKLIIPNHSPSQVSPSAQVASEKSKYYQQVFHNIIDSEVVYSDELASFIKNYLDPLADAKMVSSHTIGVIRSNIDEISSFASKFSHELSDVYKLSESSHRIGTLFLTVLPDLKRLLNKYCLNHPVAVAAIQNNNDKLKEFAEQYNTFGILELTTVLSKPFRRVDSYGTLLKELQRHTSETHVDYNEVCQAAQLFSTFATSLHEIRKQKETELDIMNANIVDGPENFSLAGFGGIIHFSPATLIVAPDGASRESGEFKADCYVLLFHSHLVFLSVTNDPDSLRFQKKFSTHGLVIHNVKKHSTYRNVFTCTDREGELVYVAVSSTQLKSQWILLIEQEVTRVNAEMAAASHRRTRHHMADTSGASHREGVFSGSNQSGWSITNIRPIPPMTPAEIMMLTKSETSRSPKVSRKHSKRKSDKIRVDEITDITNRKTLESRALEDDAEIFSVIEAYCQSSQNRMTLHSLII